MLNFVEGLIDWTEKLEGLVCRVGLIVRTEEREYQGNDTDQGNKEKEKKGKEEMWTVVLALL